MTDETQVVEEEKTPEVEEEQEAVALAVREQPQAMALPDGAEFAVMERVANALAQSDVVPKAYRRKPADIMAACLAGRELGLPPMSAMQRIFVVDGRPTLSAEGMVSLVQKAGHEIWVDPASNAAGATVHGRRRGSAQVHTMTFTIEEAKGAGLAGKDNWKKYPKAMLRARAISALCRIAFADVLAGYAYTPEEMGAVTDEGGEVIETKVIQPAAQAPTPEPTPNAKADIHKLAEEFGETEVIDVVQTMVKEIGLEKKIEGLGDLYTMTPTWIGSLRQRLERALHDVSTHSEEDAGEVVDAEVVVNNECPHCGSECLPWTGGGAKAPKWRCTNADCKGNDEGTAPWVSWHNDPWKPDGQIEKDYGIPSPQRADDDPMPDPEKVGAVGDQAVSGSAPDKGEPEPRHESQTEPEDSSPTSAPSEEDIEGRPQTGARPEQSSLDVQPEEPKKKTTAKKKEDASG